MSCPGLRPVFWSKSELTFSRYSRSATSALFCQILQVNVWVFCSYMILRAHVQIYIESPRKRARRCVFLRISCHRFTCAAKKTHILISFSEPPEALPDALELGMVEDLSTVQDTKVISDFDLAITLSFCPSLSCNLFHTDVGQLVSKQQTELTLLTLNKRRRLLHSSRVKLPFVKMSASWCLVSMYLIWILGVQGDPVKQPIKCNSVVRHVWTLELFHWWSSWILRIFKVDHCSWLRGLCFCGHIIVINPFWITSFGVYWHIKFGSFGNRDDGKFNSPK